MLTAITGSAVRAQIGIVPEHFQQDRGVTRVERLNVSVEAFTERRVQFDFFQDVSLTVDFDRVERQDSNVTAWSGKVEGIPASSATFVISGNVLTGSVNRGDGKIYQLRTAEDGTQWGLEIDQSRFPNDEADGVPLLTPGDATEGDPGVASDDGSTIDVLVLYTPSARIAAGGTTAMQQLVQLGIAETNTAYSNSKVIQRVRLVSSQEISYQEAAAGISTDLSRLRNSNGGLEAVGTLRNTYAADLVSLWVNTEEATCGIGYLLTSPTSTASDLSGCGFSVTQLDCATGYYTFGHEMGHNMGATHGLDDPGAGGGAFSYSNGYK